MGEMLDRTEAVALLAALMPGRLLDDEGAPPELEPGRWNRQELTFYATAGSRTVRYWRSARSACEKRGVPVGSRFFRTPPERLAVPASEVPGPAGGDAVPESVLAPVRVPVPVPVPVSAADQSALEALRRKRAVTPFERAEFVLAHIEGALPASLDAPDIQSWHLLRAVRNSPRLMETTLLDYLRNAVKEAHESALTLEPDAMQLVQIDKCLKDITEHPQEWELADV